jgi:hypothetical protein
VKMAASDVGGGVRRGFGQGLKKKREKMWRVARASAGVNWGCCHGERRWHWKAGQAGTAAAGGGREQEVTWRGDDTSDVHAQAPNMNGEQRWCHGGEQERQRRWGRSGRQERGEQTEAH